MGLNFSPPRPDRLWSPSSLLSSVYRELLPRGVKRPGREYDHSFQPSAKVKNSWNYTCTPLIRLYGVVISYAQGNFTFLLVLRLIYFKMHLPESVIILMHVIYIYNEPG
jgi:hypothetical protein